MNKYKALSWDTYLGTHASLVHMKSGFPGGTRLEKSQGNCDDGAAQEAVGCSHPFLLSREPRHQMQESASP